MEEANATNPPEEHEKLITNTLAALGQVSDIDIQLLAILAVHIVRLEPAKTGVDDALKAIESLAMQRAEENR